MCKVVQFTFDCGHNLRVRKSRCHGKFRKERRDSRKAACCAEPYLITRFSIDCGPCQQIAWEKSWAEKLERAQTFLAGLTKAGLSGAQQVSEQIKKMEDEHNKDAWNIRQRFPPLHKASIERVKIRTTAPCNSYLRNEVRPEDVVETQVKSYMEGDDDNDYVRSTDPLHPVITNYSHPLDNADDSWVDEYLSQEEAKLPNSPDIGIDLGSNTWNWGAPDASDNWMDNHEVSPDFNTESSSNFVAWGPDAEVLPSSGSIRMDGLKTEEEEDIDESQVAEVLTAFWECVHADNSAHLSKPSSSHVETQLQVALQDLTIGTKKTSSVNGKTLEHEELKTDITALPMESTHYPIKSASIPMDRPTEPLWTDGAFDPPTPTTPAIEALDRPKPPRPSSKFETMRLDLNGLKDSNPHRYYACWLEVCRRELIYYEGKEGRRIPHPQRLKLNGNEEAVSG